ncbi:MAG: FecR domain-containing protein [Myxococcota bacterium]
MKNRRLAYAGVATLAVCALVTLSAQRSVEAARTTVGSVNYVSGTVLRAAAKSQSFNRLRKGARLQQGDVIKTKDSSRFEARLKDGSMLRLASNSQLQLSELSFDRRQPRKKKRVKTKLFFGRVWASVTSLFGDDSSFEVETENAVAGVRGTKFSANTSEGGDTLVKVYEGKVLVSNEPIYKVKGATKENRVEVPGPQEIKKDEWESLVAGAMQMVRVQSGGDMGETEAFNMGSEEDAEWEAWNAERDKATGFKE